MPQLIRDRKAVFSATMEDLNHTYRELRGQPDHPGFKDRAAAQVQVQMAIMAAQDVVAHAGLPVGAEPVAKTVCELGYNPYAPGTLSHKLHEEVSRQTPIGPRSAAAPDPNAPPLKRQPIRRVRATFTGTSTPNPNSNRAAVLRFVQESPAHTATVEAMEKHFGIPCRGFLQKLIEKGHLVSLSEDEL